MYALRFLITAGIAVSVVGRLAGTSLDLEASNWPSIEHCAGEDLAQHSALGLFQTQAQALKAVRAEIAQQPAAYATKLVFIKTHSTGSSTLSGILHRYCEWHGSRCAVYEPEMKPGSTFNRSALAKFALEHTGEVDIWPNHVTFEPDLFESMMPGALKVSLFRDPVSRIKSSYEHGKDASVVMDLIHRVQNNIRVQRGCGPQGEAMTVQVPLERFSDLDMVLLTEQYSLSLVLLRRKLGWNLEDLLYIRLKDHSSKMTGSWKAAMDELEQFMTMPQDRMTQAGQRFMKECIGGKEAEIYRLAQQTFNKQLQALSAEVKGEVEQDLSHLEAGLLALEQCCSSSPEDAYCIFVSEDSVDWNVRANKHEPPPSGAKDAACRKEALEAMEA